jgi:glycosyltransferase involved in cell wall biosynthesis
MPSPLRIALLAPPMEPVPPRKYAGTERVVATLASELTARGHDVTVFATGDSEVDGKLVPVVPRSLWADGYRGDVSGFVMLTIAAAARRQRDFDVIHSHLDTLGFPFARSASTPVVSTLHGRLDAAAVPLLLEQFRDIPLVAISESQRRWWPRNNWLATIHHGLRLETMPFSPSVGGYLALVGRASPEMGVVESIELAQRTGLPLRIAAKVHDTAEVEFFERQVKPHLREGAVDFLGELGPDERDPLLAGALATLMLGAWPEPFGLVAIESLATGTPVIARRAGALPEIIEHGVDGFLVDDLVEAELAVRLVGDLDRAAIRARALARFSAERMVDDYERVYRRLIATPRGARSDAAEIRWTGSTGQRQGPARAAVASPRRGAG